MEDQWDIKSHNGLTLNDHEQPQRNTLCYIAFPQLAV